MECGCNSPPSTHNSFRSMSFLVFNGVNAMVAVTETPSPAAPVLPPAPCDALACFLPYSHAVTHLRLTIVFVFSH